MLALLLKQIPEVTQQETLGLLLAELKVELVAALDRVCLELLKVFIEVVDRRSCLSVLLLLFQFSERDYPVVLGVVQDDFFGCDSESLAQ